MNNLASKALALLKGCTTGDEEGDDGEPKKKRKASYESVFGDSFDGEMEGEEARLKVKPDQIEILCKRTKFTRRELQLMYQGFKKDCPTGLVKEETFQSIYAQFFPRTADTYQYAHFVFNTFDTHRSSSFNFTDYVIGLSTLSRGSVEDKLSWIFSLHDLNGDGVLTKDELHQTISSIYGLMGHSGDEKSTWAHTERVFQMLDLNKNGVVTIDEFLESCTRNENTVNSLSVFNTEL